MICVWIKIIIVNLLKQGEGDKEQDVYLNFDTPIMCIKNNKKLNIKNGSMDFKLTGFDENKVLVNDIEFTDLEFMKHFVVAYAFTNHKVQGITIKEPYNIYEWG
jgi:ATP-dependent exoDNAse (exonuclease V) alpha subunit